LLQVHAFPSSKMIYAALLCLIPFLLLISYRRRKPNTVGFFHPYCNAGGGGERVLWCAIRSMQARFPKLKYIVFSGDRDASKEQILLRAKQRFNIEIDPSNVDFVFLRLRSLVETRLPFTLLLQTLAGGVLSVEALCYLCPSLMIDSMGYPLSLPIFKWLGGSDVAAYVHYPTISCDMIDVVARRESSFNNKGIIARWPLLSQIKLAYYKAFAKAYGLAGRAADVVMVNGSWTASHIRQLWQQECSVVFPPCDIEGLLAIPGRAEEVLKNDKRVNILSIGQIRPEKNHKLQLEILKEVLEGLRNRNIDVKVDVTLTIAGGCRNEDDESRVKELKELAEKLGLQKNLEWKLNVPYGELIELLNSSLISLHTMHNEHFGISVVEALAAGTIMVAHKSGGPAMDIVVPCEGEASVGYLASTREEFVSSILSIISLSPSSRSQIRESARLSSQRFSEGVFEEKWNEAIGGLIESTA
ncbi:hypothetical protein PMAYCL1PPCAC_12159, partial [Pristionchus mayeri]